MNEAFAWTLAGFELALRVSLPALAVAFAVGVVLSGLLAWTRLGDATLSALPRAALTLLLLGSVGGWMAHQLLAYSSQLYLALPALTR